MAVGVLATRLSLCLLEFSLLSVETNTNNSNRNNEAADIIKRQQTIDQICRELCKNTQIA